MIWRNLSVWTLSKNKSEIRLTNRRGRRPKISLKDALGDGDVVRSVAATKVPGASTKS